MIAGLASIVPTTRSAEDIFAGRIRVELGDRTYTLPVRSRKANREWLESLDTRFVDLLGTLERIDDSDQVLTLLFSATERFLDALISYDATNALPSAKAIDAQATDIEIIRAVLEVWRAANPLVAIGLGLARPDAESPPTPSTKPSPSPLAPTAGRRARSRKS